LATVGFASFVALRTGRPREIDSFVVELALPMKRETGASERRMHGECKSPGGKLVVVDFELVGGCLTSVQVSGDFFLIPDEALVRLNAGLEGAPADADLGDRVAMIEGRLAPTDRLVGVTPEAVAIAIERALGRQ
jgi:lipoate---protein ligase